MIVFIGFLKAVLRTIIKWVIRIIVERIIQWLISKVLEWLLKKFEEEIEKILKTFNEHILTNIIKIDQLLTETQSKIYEYIDNFTDQLINDLIIIMEVSPDEIDTLFASVSIEDWLKEFISRVSSKAGLIVKDILQALLKPVELLLEAAKKRINDIVSHIETLNRIINEDINNEYDSFNDNIDNVQTTYNQHASELVIVINNLTNALDQSIANLKNKIEAQEQAFNDQQTNINESITTLQSFLQTSIPLNTEITVDQADAIAQGAINIFTNQQIDIVQFNPETFRYDLPNINGLVCTIPLQKIDVYYNLEFLIKYLQEINTHLNEVKTRHENLPTIIETSFPQDFTKYLENNTQGEIEAIIETVSIRIFSLKRNEIFQRLKAAKTILAALRATVANEIVAITNRIRAEIALYEIETVEKLPELLQPIGDAYLKELEGQIVEFGDKIMVNIDNIAPDIIGIDQLIESFPSAIKAREFPNKADSRTFHINDIYRLLCNYFDRAERTALIIHLADQDMPSDIENFINFPK